MKIELTNKSKVNNPLDYEHITDSFEGELNEDFDFKFQKINFDKLVKTLEQFELNLEYIWSCNFTNNVDKSMFTFIAKTNKVNDKQLYWHKYEAKQPGGAQNKIYLIKDNKVHKLMLTKWLGVTDENRRIMFDNM